MGSSDLVVSRSLLISKNWIVGPSFDFFYFIGPVLISFLLVGLFHFCSSYLSVPENWMVHSTNFIFMAFLDLPHLFQTFIRTNFDKAEFKRNPRFYKWGPILILILWALIYNWDNLGIFFIIVRFFGYWHLFKQDWGILRVYKIKNQDYDYFEEKFDSLVFYLSRIGCVVLSEIYFTTLNITKPLKDFIPYSQAKTIYLTIFILLMMSYFIYQASKLFRNKSINLPKILFLFFILVGNIIIFLYLSFPPVIVFILCTAYHDVQYHGWIRYYGEKRFKTKIKSFKAIFYLTFLVSFILAIPYILFYSKALILLYLSLAFHHYYVDGKIWKFPKRGELREMLS